MTDEQNTSIQTQQANSREMVYTPLAQSHEIKLSRTIVRTMLCRPTKSGALPDDQDVTRFMMLCRARELNPFEGDAFLIGYDGKDGPQFSLITAIQSLYKRAEGNQTYDGIESGVIVGDPKGNIVERVGDFQHPGDTLLGGWSRVHRKNQSYPVIERMNVENRDKGRSLWNTDKAGMIVKCAEAAALRRAFPSQTAGLYVAGEMLEEDIATVKPVQRRELASIDTATVIGGADETPNQPGGTAANALKPSGAEPNEADDPAIGVKRTGKKKAAPKGEADKAEVLKDELESALFGGDKPATTTPMPATDEEVEKVKQIANLKLAEVGLVDTGANRDLLVAHITKGTGIDLQAPTGGDIEAILEGIRAMTTEQVAAAIA